MLDELKMIAPNTKAAIVNIAEPKIDNFVSNSNIEIPGQCIL